MRSNRRRFIGLMVGAPAAVALASPALASVRADRLHMPAGQTAEQVHGINPADMDLSADPRNDFYRYANGGWLDRVTIPSDKATYGVFTELNDRTTAQLVGLLKKLAETSSLEEGSDEWKAVQLFRQGTDIATRNQQGISPIKGTLDQIRAVEDLASLHRFFRDAPWLGVSHLFSVSVFPDFLDSTVHALYWNGPALGLPNRDYYLEDTEANKRAREAYIATSAMLLSHAGYEPSTTRETAEAVYELERQLASETLTREESQDASVVYNPMAIAELGEQYPQMDWQRYLESLGLDDVDQVIVTEPRYLQALDGIIQHVPLEVIKDYLVLNTVWAFAENLSEDIESTAFSLSAALSGVTEQAPLEERVLNQVNASMTDAVGKVYVAAYFPPEARQRISELVDEIIEAFGIRLEQNSWMTSATKAKAQEKLGKLRVKVGYPDEWFSYEDVTIGDSYAATSLSAGNVETRYYLDQLNKPVDKSEWGAPAQQVNAFYNSIYNDITFPAAILQPPFFDHEADPASNLGAIGYVIGHEITHGFDQGGAQFDGDGNLTNWWTEADYEAFELLNQRVVEQYGAIEVLPGVFIDGQITVGENVADLGGIQVAHDALETLLNANGSSLNASLDGPLTAVTPGTPPIGTPIASLATPVASPAVAPPVSSPVAIQQVQSLTQGERFFVAAATVWRSKIRDEALVTHVQTDTHSPTEVRATQPLRNTDSFHQTFGIQPGDPMHLDPEDRIVIW